MINKFKALSDENRLRIVNLLLSSELCVCEIELILGMTQSNASRHLTKLKSAGIIDSYKDSQWVHYKIDEGFLKSDKELVMYMKVNFSKDSIYTMDSENLCSYKKSSMGCKDITTNKLKLNDILE